MSPSSDNPTVYSTETGRICPNCGRPKNQCVCKKKQGSAPRGDGIVRVKIESKGRAGKTVTVISGLGLNDDGLKIITSQMKKLCGAGGAVKDGEVEIQGDFRDSLMAFLKQQGYVVKRVGGK